jgi:beta-phosphoglucomutase-like phosphatase (HAD superfamily)
MSLRALVFDVDGTLAETEEAHRRAFNETFAEAGLDWHWPFGRYRELLRVTGGKERMRRHALDIGEELPMSGPRSIGELHARKTERYNAFVRSGAVGLRPGVAELIADAEREGLALAIATTTTLENVETLIRSTLRREPAEVFAVICAGDMVKAKKPAPDIYIAALDRLGLPPDAAVAVEDSAVGLAAARGARLSAIVTPSLYTAGDDFSGALRVLPELAWNGRPLDVATLAAWHARAAAAGKSGR